MVAAVPVLQILALAVAIRVGNATGSTLLKGSGQHKLLAFTNLGAGVVNIVLSIVLVRQYGIVGVAIGTVIPIAAAAVFILNPAACRRVGLPISQLLLRSVIPAVWPGLVMAGALLYTRSISSGTLLAVAMQAAAGGVLYLVLLIGLAIGRHNRQLYVGKVKQLLGRRRKQAPGGVTARPADNSAGV